MSRETVTFSGTRSPKQEHLPLILDAVDELGPDARVISGAARGVDSLIAVRAISRGLAVHAVIPCTTDPADIGWLRSEGVTWEHMPAGTSFKDRDGRMVELGDRLIAFPLFPEADDRSRRSGTWLTVRLARKAGKPVDVYVLDGAS